MNILLINHYAGSPEMGMEFRPYYFAREWVKMGHKVDIIAADYSHLRRKNPEIKADFQKEVIEGINYHWIKTNTYEGNGVSRAITMAQFIGKLWFHAKTIVQDMDPDVVICSSTYPLDTFVGQRIKKLSKKKIKLVHEIHDMWPATLTELGGMHKYHPFVIAMQIGENSFCKKSDYVVSLLPHAETYLKLHGLKENKFVCIPNGIVVSEWRNAIPLPEEHEKLLKDLHNQGKFIVGYFGGHAISNALDKLIEIAHRITDQSIHFVLVGDGVEKKKLIRQAEELGCSNVSFLPSVPKQSIPNLCKAYDCIYIGLEDNALARFGTCLNKMFDSMFSGKPILCLINKTANETYVKIHNCGVEESYSDEGYGVNGILKLKNMSDEERRRLGQNGINAIECNYLYERLAEKFLEYLV